MLDYFLFRAKALRPMQASMFHSEVTNSELIVAVLESRPSFEPRRGHYWHIGNVQRVDATGFYFAVGRTTRSTYPLFDDTTGNFVEREFESAPYTHGVMDSVLGVMAVARKTQLTPKAGGVARQIEKLFTFSVPARAVDTQFAVAPISDPEEFLEYIRTAQAVPRFDMTFTRPNPFDVNADFQLPLERALQEANGTEGKATLKGSDLNPAVLEEFTRSAAAAGNDVSARLYPEQGNRPIIRRLRGNEAVVSAEAVSDEPQERAGLLQKVRQFYQRIRHVEGSG